MKFRVEIPRYQIVGASLVGYARALNYCEGIQMDYPKWWDARDRDVRIVEGEAPAEIVTVLQAIARGDDLNVVLDMLGAP